MFCGLYLCSVYLCLCDFLLVLVMARSTWWCCVSVPVLVIVVVVAYLFVIVFALLCVCVLWSKNVFGSIVLSHAVLFSLPHHSPKGSINLHSRQPREPPLKKPRAK